MVIPSRIVVEMIEQARAEYPNECCGLLAGQNGRVVACYPITNTDASPVHYTMDTGEQLRAILEIDDRDWDLSAIYHSHTHSRAYPSPTDIKLAYYPGTLYVIISLADDERPEVRAFAIEDGAVQERTLEIIDEGSSSVSDSDQPSTTV